MGGSISRLIYFWSPKYPVSYSFFRCLLPGVSSMWAVMEGLKGHLFKLFREDDYIGHHIVPYFFSKI